MSDVRATGPLFDGRAKQAIRDFCREAEQEIADQGVEDVQHQLDRVLKHPTGWYRSHIQTDSASVGVEINDDGIIYGPWLEGVGSRNKTTRFKGYFTFRKVNQTLQRKAKGIAETVLPKYLRRMN